MSHKSHEIGKVNFTTDSREAPSCVDTRPAPRKPAITITHQAPPHVHDHRPHDAQCARPHETYLILRWLLVLLLC